MEMHTSAHFQSATVSELPTSHLMNLCVSLTEKSDAFEHWNRLHVATHCTSGLYSYTLKKQASSLYYHIAMELLTADMKLKK